MEILRNWITPAQQLSLLEHTRKHKALFKRAFYKGGNPKGSSYRMQSFGKYAWNSLTYRYDELDLPAIPQFIIDHCLSLGTNAECMLTHLYPIGSRLSLHQDHLERPNVPLVSYSLGCDADFAYCKTRNSPKKTVTLRNGDVLIMAGEYRRYFHEITRVYGDPAPLQTGRLPPPVRQIAH